MIRFPIGYHSKDHASDNALHRDPDCGYAKIILRRCSCDRRPEVRCDGCFTRTGATHWNLAKDVLSNIEKRLLPHPEGLPHPIAPKDLRVQTFIQSLNSGTNDLRTALLRRCEQAGLVVVEHNQDDYEPRLKDLTNRGQQLLTALESNIDCFDRWELEDPWDGLQE